MTPTPAATEREELVELLRSIIRVPTEDPPGREIELARHVHQTLLGWGLRSELDEFSPGRANVVARLGAPGPRPALAFSAHLDTMPAGSSPWRHPPFAADEADGRVYGRGAADMKGGLAAMMHAAERLAHGASALQGELVLAFSAGESSSCLGAKRLVETGALRGVGAILVSEPSSLRVLVAEKGALWVKAVAKGTPGHASGAAAKTGAGDNAILRIVDCVGALREMRFGSAGHALLGEPDLRFGTVQGGSAVNLTPDHAELGIDVRYLPGMTRAQILEVLQERVGADVALETMDDKPPVEVCADHPFVLACLAACRAVLGTVDPPGGAAYFSDSNVLCPALGVPRVIVGPGELGMSGQRDEHVEVAKLIAATEIYVRLAADVLGPCGVEG